MNPRERVLLALNHQEPDRIPIDLGATIVSSITRRAYIDLKAHLGMPLEEITMLDNVQQLPYLDEALMERFHSDFRLVQLPAATAPGLDGRVFHGAAQLRHRSTIRPTRDRLGPYAYPALLGHR